MNIDVEAHAEAMKHESDQRWGVTRRDILRYGAAAAAASFVSLPGVGRARASSAFRVVETTYGKLRGRVSEGVAAFLGVRYGADTGGSNRFMPPQPVTPWSGVHDALALGNQCAQINPDLPTFPTWVDPSPATEDCLMLNVFGPASATASSRLPVMVWLHGGGYNYGSAFSHVYNCGNIAKVGNVVTVGINHRLNGFGYTYLGDQQDDRFVTSGNAGHLDIIQALQWVRDNIEKFGGDPANVTVFGQSGGGGKITTICGMPAAKGLFHKAIIQSGSLLRIRTPNEASNLTNAVFDHLQLKRGDVKALQAVPTKTLLKCFDNAAKTQWNYAAGVVFGPMVDGHAMPEMIWRDKAPDFVRDIPVLMGTNSQELAGFIGFDMYAPLKDDMAMASACARTAVIYKFNADQLLPIVRKYRELMPQLSDAQMVVRISTDINLWKGAITQSDMLIARQGAPVYVYECAWQTPCFKAKWALHGVELPFIFNVTKYGTAWDGKDSDALRAAADPKNIRSVVGREMLDAWLNFARSGNPSTQALAWSAYDSRSRATMVFDAQSKLLDNPHKEVRDVIRDL